MRRYTRECAAPSFANPCQRIVKHLRERETHLTSSYGRWHNGQMSAVRTILLAGFVTAMACPARGEPYDPPPMPYRAHGYGRCYPFASCASYRQFQILEQRRQQSEELRRKQQSPVTFGKSPQGGQSTTPTDEAEVQPDYIGSGQIRDQYQESGETLPEFLDRGVLPSR
jgi:hypothetical protein